LDTNLADILWNFTVAGLIFLAAALAVWAARRYRGWLNRKYEEPPKWAAISTFGVWLGVFACLAVLFGFVIDR
jgi:4-hydroxybenzoate polyprenyltransferase